MFLQFWVGVSKRAKFAIAIFIHASDNFHDTVLENAIFRQTMIYCLGNLTFAVKKFCQGLDNIAKKFTVFGNLSTITQKGNMENR